MILSGFTASDWALLLPIFFFQLTACVVAIINTVQNTKQGKSIETVHTAVNSSADKLAASNKETIDALTGTITTQTAIIAAQSPISPTEGTPSNVPT